MAYGGNPANRGYAHYGGHGHTGAGNSPGYSQYGGNVQKASYAQAFATTADIGIPILSGLLARGQAKVQAMWLEIQQLQINAENLKRANEINSGHLAELGASGFVGGGTAVLRAETSAAVEDNRIGSLSAQIQADAIRQQGRDAAIAGFFKGAEKAATAFAGAA